MGGTDFCNLFPRFHGSPIASLCADFSSFPLSWDFSFRIHLNDHEVGELAELLLC